MVNDTPTYNNRSNRLTSPIDRISKHLSMNLPKHISYFCI